MDKKYLFDNLPGFYKVHDNENDNILERTLSNIEEFGIEPIAREIDEIDNLIDIDNCPVENLPYLFNMIGLPFEPDIPEKFQRIILKNGSILNQRKGTKSCLEFLAKELSGANSEIFISLKDEIKIVLLNLNIYEEQAEALLVAQDVINKYMKNFIPALMNYELATSYRFSDTYNKENVYYEEGIINIIENTTDIYSISKIQELEKSKLSYIDTEDFLITKMSHSITNDFGSLTNSSFYTNSDTHYDNIL